MHCVYAREPQALEDLQEIILAEVSMAIQVKASHY